MLKETQSNVVSNTQRLRLVTDVDFQKSNISFIKTKSKKEKELDVDEYLIYVDDKKQSLTFKLDTKRSSWMQKLNVKENDKRVWYRESQREQASIVSDEDEYKRFLDKARDVQTVYLNVENDCDWESS